MSPILIDGKALGSEIDEKLTAWVAEACSAENRRKPALAVVLVGDDPASHVYVRNKVRRTKAAGMESIEHRLPDTTTQQEIMDLVQALNQDDKVDGILVQLPLPEGVSSEIVINTIDPAKDVDGFHLMNVGMLATDTGDPLIPCTPNGSMVMLRRTLKELGKDIAGLNALVIGRSNIVGKPMASLLLAARATVTIAHSKTKNLPELCKEADIVVAAVGRPLMVKGDWIRKGAIVIDVGINRIIDADGNAKIVGDVDFDAAAEVAAAITPVPGGVGPMTIAMLLVNTVRNYARREGLDFSFDM